MLINVMRDEHPTRVAVAFDLSRRTLRTGVFPEYKAGRADSPAEFHGQVGLIREVLAGAGDAGLSVEGFEADDIIATLTRRTLMHVRRPLSGDRDAFQLVSGRVSSCTP